MTRQRNESAAGHWTLGIWLRVQEPRLITVLQTLIYLLCAGAGWSTITNPPSSVEGQLGASLTMLWGLFALIGGVSGALSCPPGKWLIEKPAILLCGTAILMYAGIIITLHLSSPGNRLPQLFFVLISLVSFAIRYARIKPYSYQPGK